MRLRLRRRLVGSVFTLLTFMHADENGGKFYVATGLIVSGLVLIGRSFTRTR